MNKDINKAVEWLEKAANQGDIESQLDLARLYCYGAPNFQVDIQKGLEWFSKISDEDKRSSLQLRLHVDGIIETDPVDLINLCEIALKKNNDPVAMIALGVMYCSGEGVRANPKKGANYIDEGMKHCKEPLSPFFCLRIGMLYYEGKVNESGYPDLKNAMPFLEKAVAIGDKKLIAFVNDLREQFKREELEQNIRSAEWLLESSPKYTCSSCNNKDSEQVFTKGLGTWMGTKIICKYGYYEWRPEGRYGESEPTPGDISKCPKLNEAYQAYQKIERLKNELEALDKAPSIG